MLKLYGTDLSSNSFKVQFVLHALGLEYEYKRVNLMQGEHKTEAFLKLNPIGKIPVLQDDDFVLSESGAIVKYLCEKQRSEFYPEGLRHRATINQWIDFATLHVGFALNKVLYNRVFVKLMKTEVDEVSLKDGLALLERFLPNVNAQLEKKKNIANDSLSLADFTLLSFLDPAEVAGIDLIPYKALTQWRSDLRKKDFYTKTHTSYEDVIKALR